MIAALYVEQSQSDKNQIVMTETFNFLSGLPPRELTQWDEERRLFAAWRFDGTNPVSARYYGSTREAALQSLRDSQK